MSEQVSTLVNAGTRYMGEEAREILDANLGQVVDVGCALVSFTGMLEKVCRSGWFKASCLAVHPARTLNHVRFSIKHIEYVHVDSVGIYIRLKS